MKCHNSQMILKAQSSLDMSQYKMYTHNISDIPVYNTNTFFFNSSAFVISMGLLINLKSLKNLTKKSYQIVALSNVDCRFFSLDIKG